MPGLRREKRKKRREEKFISNGGKVSVFIMVFFFHVRPAES